GYFKDQLCDTTIHHFGISGIEHFRLKPSLSVAAAVTFYGRDPSVAYIEPNYRCTSASACSRVPDDPRFSEQCGMTKIDAPEAWCDTTGNPDLKIGVVDTGVDYNHPDLRENMWVNPGESGTDSLGRDKSSNGVDDDADGCIDDVHGCDFTGSEPSGNPIEIRKAGIYSHGTHIAG